MNSMINEIVARFGVAPSEVSTWNGGVQIAMIAGIVIADAFGLPLTEKQTAALLFGTIAVSCVVNLFVKEKKGQ
jgi:hypothetical protein